MFKEEGAIVKGVSPEWEIDGVFVHEFDPNDFARVRCGRDWLDCGPSSEGDEMCFAVPDDVSGS